MIIKSEIGEKWEIFIPKKIMEHLGLRKGGKVIFEIIDNEVAIRSEQNPIKFVNVNV